MWCATLVWPGFLAAQRLEYARGWGSTAGFRAPEDEPRTRLSAATSVCAKTVRQREIRGVRQDRAQGCMSRNIASTTLISALFREANRSSYLPCASISYSSSSVARRICNRRFRQLLFFSSSEKKKKKSGMVPAPWWTVN